MRIKTRQDLIKAYIDFFKSKKHKEIPSSSLIPKNDPTVLFTTAGMHPLIPYLLGQPHPSGKRLVDVQKCIRTQDIEEVGDTYHHTFFEMLGNWSLGDYFKKEAIEFSFEFLTKILKIPTKNLGITCFGGDKRIPALPKDNEAEKIWLSLKIPRERIAFLEGGVLESKKNWWGPTGEIGPCGPDTEMHYWRSSKPAPKKFNPDDETWVELWNDVFMQYNKDEKGNYNPAKQKNIDTGMGVERVLSILLKLEDDYLTPTFLPIIKEIESLSNKKYGKDEGETRSMRIIADHIKASVFIIADGIVPSNTEQGYVLRRLIRRAARYGKELGIKNFTPKIAETVFPIYSDYKELEQNKKKILEDLKKEEERFEKVLKEGLKKAEKILKNKKPIKKEKYIKLQQLENKIELLRKSLVNRVNKKPYAIKEANISEKEIDEATIEGKEAFDLFQSFGYPIEMIMELAREKLLFVDRGTFKKELQKHQELSRKATKGKFKSGLADDSEKTRKLHTATHLLNEALRHIIDKNIKQKGSNINPERLRFDFNFSRKLTKEEIKKVEDLVNKKIKSALTVKKEEMPLKKALDSGAQAEFGAKYPEKVFVYTIEDPSEKSGWFSKEICTGPHVKNTSELGKFKIIKEESSAAGIRRIKAILE